MLAVAGDTASDSQIQRFPHWRDYIWAIYVSANTLQKF